MVFVFAWGGTVEEEAFDPTKALVWNPVTKSYVPAHLLGSETQSESWRD